MIRGVVEANEIELLRPVLRLALDEDEGWNWQSFGQALGSRLPARTTSRSRRCKITDGVLAVHGPDGAERTRLEAFSGELSAPSLQGPYRYRGTFGKGEAKRELRLSTAKAEDDGAVRFKASLRMGDGASTYTLDGRVGDLSGKPHIEGDLTARLPVAGLWQSRIVAQPKKLAASGTERRRPFDLRASVYANPPGQPYRTSSCSSSRTASPSC